MLKLDVIASRRDCDIRIYKDLPLPMAVLQGWFNDQHRCFEMFIEALSDRQRQSLFADREVLDSVKDTYRGMWSNGQFEKVAIWDKGVHRRFDHLVPWSRKRRGFLYPNPPPKPNPTTERRWSWRPTTAATPRSRTPYETSSTASV